jgi:hypothetical protein
MKLEKLSTSALVCAIRMLCHTSFKRKKLSDWAQRHGVDNWSKLNKAQLRDALITYCINMCVSKEGMDPRIQIWPEVQYGEVARYQGLASHERLNLLPDGKDEHEEWDELFDDLPVRNGGPLDKPTLVIVLSLQASMEMALVTVDTYSDPAFDQRHVQRAALDRRMKALTKHGNGGPEHYKLTQKMMAANSKARNAAKVAGREDPHPEVTQAWDHFNEIKEKMERLMGTDKRYYSYVTDIAPFVPKTKARDTRIKLRLQRIEWLKEAMDEVQAELDLMEKDGIPPNWVYRDDRESEVYDDAWAHNASLNRGEDMAWDHVREERRQEMVGPLKLWVRQKKWEYTRGDQAYDEWLTKKYQAWWARVLASRRATQR